MKLRYFDSGPDNGVDRYTVLDEHMDYIGMSSEPFHPQGFCQHGSLENTDFKFTDGLEHIGKEIQLADLPQKCKRVVKIKWNPTKPNVRLHEYINNGEVVITLKPGKTLTYYSGGPHEEGYSRSEEEWEYDDVEDIIIYQHWTQSRDCDGRLDHYTKMALRVEDVVPHTCPAELPWRYISGISGCQRDYNAEAMGY